MVNINAQEYLNSNYKDKTITELNLSGWSEKDWKEKPNWEKLTGVLDLSDFPNLEKLNCFYNQITALNLSNCPNLTELKCWDNQLTEIKFPKSLKLRFFQAWTNDLTELDWKAFDPHTLTYISVSNNDLQDQDLKIFNKFTNLEELYLGTDIISRLEERKYNRFHGSLGLLLKNCPRLKKLQMEGTGVEEDLKHLPKNLEIISWHKQNKVIAEIIPLERLYVIRNSIQHFLKKWGEKFEYSWYQLDYWKKPQLDGNKATVLSQLKHPDDFSKQWWLIRSVQWANRATLVAGGSLVFVGQSDTSNPHSQLYTQTGGVIAIVGPFVETLTSYLNDQVYDAKQKQWDKFLTDTEVFLANYNELVGILSQFEKSNKLKGAVNKAIKGLSEKIRKFLAIYDKDENGEIDINELTSERNKLIEDLAKDEKSEAQEIVKAIKELEKAIIEYRKFAYYEETLATEQQKEDNKQQKEEAPQATVDLDEWARERLEARIEIQPK
jgi:Leucine-rich repeat (LRR) protein